MIVTDCLDEYFSLMERKPALFSPSPVFPIVTDRCVIERYEKESGKKIGVLYKSRFNTLVVDLIDGENGLFTYERIVPTALGRGVVCVPIVNGKLVLLNQYRHSIRKTQLCFPRGFGEDGVSAEENAQKELLEEIGARDPKCVFLGFVTADSGLIGAECGVFRCDIDNYDKMSTEEGIKQILLLDEREFEEGIASGEINDGFTLSAYALLKNCKTEL